MKQAVLFFKREISITRSCEVLNSFALMVWFSHGFMSWVMWHSLHSRYEPWDMLEVRAKAQQPWSRAESWAWLSSWHANCAWKNFCFGNLNSETRHVTAASNSYHAEFHALQNQWAIRVWPRQHKWKHLELSGQGSETVQIFCILTTRCLPWNVVQDWKFFQLDTADLTLGCVLSSMREVTASLVNFFYL